jgi:hypothetical protein
MAAASLSLQITKLEETNRRAIRAQTLGEAASRLWQFGLAPSKITSLLLYSNDTSINSFSVTSTGDTSPTAEGTPTSDLGTFSGATVTVTARTQDANTTAGHSTILHSDYVFYPVR